jgi:hypothetical protein
VLLQESYSPYIKVYSPFLLGNVLALLHVRYSPYINGYKCQRSKCIKYAHSILFYQLNLRNYASLPISTVTYCISTFSIAIGKVYINAQICQPLEMPTISFYINNRCLQCQGLVYHCIYCICQPMLWSRSREKQHYDAEANAVRRCGFSSRGSYTYVLHV